MARYSALIVDSWILRSTHEGTVERSEGLVELLVFDESQPLFEVT